MKFSWMRVIQESSSLMQSSTDTELMVNLCGGFVWRATLEQGVLLSSRAAITRVRESLPRDVNAECVCFVCTELSEKSLTFRRFSSIIENNYFRLWYYFTVLLFCCIFDQNKCSRGESMYWRICIFYYISLLIIPCITIMWQIKKPWTYWGLLVPWKKIKKLVAAFYLIVYTFFFVSQNSAFISHSSLYISKFCIYI